ncbi:type II restriction endonuclease [Sinomonas atrocyanea]|uniref:type II restriction endonuclease n=1 Tax=Sinomonas atrocyanea TaxID=37927 RepID=UPI002859FB4C|nr:type II restriction endonuclease [Sinomonas atrocyanea]MDR6622474.1 YD repeat-containing protein [Sinomonas atrocyanea]
MYALKVLASVDVSRFRSNQHEFNGATSFRRALGTPTGKTDVRAAVLELDYDDLDRTVSRTETWMTWYNARENNARRAPEFRLYYRPEIDGIVSRANPGDVLVLCRVPGRDCYSLEATVAFARQDSAPASVLTWALSRQQLNAESSTSALFPTLNLPHGSIAAMDAVGLSLGVRFRVEAPEEHLVGPDDRIASRFDQIFRDHEQALALDFNECQGRAGESVISVFFEARARARGLTGWGAAELRELLTEELGVAALEWKPALDRDDAGLLIETRQDSVWVHVECRPLVDSAVLGHLARDGFPQYLLTLQPGLGASALREIAGGGCQLVVPRQLHGAYPEEWRSRLLTVSEWTGRLS